MKLSRKALEEGLNQVPISHILGADVSRQLTAKQRKFAHEVAKGSTKADAYRAAYNVKSAKTMEAEPYRLAADPRVAREIEAYTLALETAKLRSPAALRELVIQSLVRVIVDPESKPGQITAAAKVLGTVTEVAAFTERKEVRTISSSDDARARVMSELRGILTAQAQDATIIEADADSLLAELSVKFNAAPEGNETAPDADPPTGHPPDDAAGVPRP
jgi:phage terminase small subunit